MSALVAALLLQAASGPSVIEVPVLVPGRFVRSTGGLACTQTGEELARNRGYESCLRIGSLRIGMPRAEAEALLGEPFTSMGDPDGGRAHIYVLAWEGRAGESQPRAYLAVVYGQDGGAKMIQLSGQRPPGPPWSMSGVELGSSDAILRRTLGQPFASHPVQRNGAVQWSYRPWPISFEVKDSTVISIRVEAPGADAPANP